MASMRANNHGFAVFIVILVILIGGITAAAIWRISRSDGSKNSQNPTSSTSPSPQPEDPNNTPEQNKDIEIKAAETKNPALCQQIKGESYKFGPRDETIRVSEAEATKRCLENIEENSVPSKFGG